MILNGTGAASILGTPCGRQLASGSSTALPPSLRWSQIALAAGRKGTSSLISTAVSRRYLVPSGSQTPERSGLPSASRGAGAVRFGLPSGVRGSPAVGTFSHCAETQVQTANAARAVLRIILPPDYLPVRCGTSL